MMRYTISVKPSLPSKSRNALEAFLERDGYRVVGSELDCNGEYCDIYFIESEKEE